MALPMLATRQVRAAGRLPAQPEYDSSCAMPKSTATLLSWTHIHRARKSLSVDRATAHEMAVCGHRVSGLDHGAVRHGALLINKTDTKVAFFGETPEVTPENVSTYHRWLVALAVAIAFSFGAALLHRGQTARSRYWHGFVLVAGLLSAAAFHVALDAPIPEPGPVPDRSGTVCHSGSDNYCVGG